MRHKAYAPIARTRDRRMRSWGRVLHSVRRPVPVDPHYAPAEQSARWWGVRGGITVGQTRASGTNQHWGHTNGRSATRRVSPLPQGRGRATSEKEGGRGLRPCEDTRARVWLPARRLLLQKSVGDVWLQISSANALQKERSGSSERGPSSERTLAGETVSGCFGRNGDSRVGLTREDGRGPAQGSGWRELVIQRSHHRPKR